MGVPIIAGGKWGRPRETETCQGCPDHVTHYYLRSQPEWIPGSLLMQGAANYSTQSWHFRILVIWDGQICQGVGAQHLSPYVSAKVSLVLRPKHPAYTNTSTSTPRVEQWGGAAILHKQQAGGFLYVHGRKMGAPFARQTREDTGRFHDMVISPPAFY